VFRRTSILNFDQESDWGLDIGTDDQKSCASTTKKSTSRSSAIVEQALEIANSADADKKSSKSSSNSNSNNNKKKHRHRSRSPKASSSRKRSPVPSKGENVEATTTTILDESGTSRTETVSSSSSVESSSLPVDSRKATPSTPTPTSPTTNDAGAGRRKSAWELREASKQARSPRTSTASVGSLIKPQLDNDDGDNLQLPPGLRAAASRSRPGGDLNRSTHSSASSSVSSRRSAAAAARRATSTTLPPSKQRSEDVEQNLHLPPGLRAAARRSRPGGDLNVSTHSSASSSVSSRRSAAAAAAAARRTTISTLPPSKQRSEDVEQNLHLPPGLRAAAAARSRPSGDLNMSTHSSASSSVSSRRSAAAAARRTTISSLPPSKQRSEDAEQNLHLPPGLRAAAARSRPVGGVDLNASTHSTASSVASRRSAARREGKTASNTLPPISLSLPSKANQPQDVEQNLHLPPALRAAAQSRPPLSSAVSSNSLNMSTHSATSSASSSRPYAARRTVPSSTSSTPVAKSQSSAPPGRNTSMDSSAHNKCRRSRLKTEAGNAAAAELNKSGHRPGRTNSMDGSGHRARTRMGGGGETTTTPVTNNINNDSINNTKQENVTDSSGPRARRRMLKKEQLPEEEVSASAERRSSGGKNASMDGSSHKPSLRMTVKASTVGAGSQSNTVNSASSTQPRRRISSKQDGSSSNLPPSHPKTTSSSKDDNDTTKANTESTAEPSSRRSRRREASLSKPAAPVEEVAPATPSRPRYVAKTAATPRSMEEIIKEKEAFIDSMLEADDEAEEEAAARRAKEEQEQRQEQEGLAAQEAATRKEEQRLQQEQAAAAVEKAAQDEAAAREALQESVIEDDGDIINKLRSLMAGNGPSNTRRSSRRDRGATRKSSSPVPTEPRKSVSSLEPKPGDALPPAFSTINKTFATSRVSRTQPNTSPKAGTKMSIKTRSSEVVPCTPTRSSASQPGGKFQLGDDMSIFNTANKSSSPTNNQPPLPEVLSTPSTPAWKLREMAKRSPPPKSMNSSPEPVPPTPSTPSTPAWKLRGTAKRSSIGTPGGIIGGGSNHGFGSPQVAELPPAFHKIATPRATPRSRRAGSSYLPGSSKREQELANGAARHRRGSVLGSMSNFLDEEKDEQGKKRLTKEGKVETTADGKKRIVFELGDIPPEMLMAAMANGGRIPGPLMAPRK
jgi:hypothetical protein